MNIGSEKQRNHDEKVVEIEMKDVFDVGLMHSLILVWFLSPFQLPNSQCGAYSQ